ncbi:recombinase family protein [Paenibacillus doosanensis]|uniref:recombinase family protein n=1 Tax=Paenibacillus doosanensis TaxID=1229154 RepID=UPI0021801BD7|nr:recombinase family protein [Paenibacillus doosanensis]MCS7460356.1 recombinase family protein [Paenibacillus doosanensis]
MSRKLGYARVSKGDQNYELQIDALIKAGVEERDIFKEKMTGSKKERPELDKLLAYAQPGDCIVVWKLDRIGRNIKHLIELSEYFRENNIHFISLKENIDTASIAGKLMFTIMAALAEFEREMIIERTYAGLEAARARGRVGGRKPKDTESIELALKLYQSKEYPIHVITKMTGVSKTTIYRYLNRDDKGGNHE